MALRSCSFRVPPTFKRPDKTQSGLKYSAVFLRGVLWNRGQTVRIGFMDDGRPNGVQYDPSFLADGDPLERVIQNMSPVDMVKRVVKDRIQPFVDLNLEFVNDPRNADIRISFSTPSGGAWSYIGNSSVYDVPHDEPSMNFGFLSCVVISHEILHSLGMVHEHSNPKKGIQWDEEVVLKWAQETQGWDEETTRRNILTPLDKGSVNGSDFDSESIMLYAFDKNFTKCKCLETKWNKVLSLTDAKWLVKMYNPGADYAKIYAEVYSDMLPSAARDAKVAPVPGAAAVVHEVNVVVTFSATLLLLLAVSVFFSNARKSSV